MHHPDIITADQLLEVTEFTREGDLVAALEKQGIKLFRGKGGRPWTTMALINKAGGVGLADNEPRLLGPEDV